MDDVSFVHLATDDKQQLESFLSEIDNLYTPRLTYKTDLAVFAEKILSNGHVICACSNGQILGAVTFYSNDLAGRTAYISLVGVKENYTNMHIASKLVHQALAYIRTTSMIKCGIHTNNVIAKHIYEKIGFNIISVDKSNPPRYYLEYIL